MDASRFDRLARQLARSRTRRRALAAGLGSLLAVATRGHKAAGQGEPQPVLAQLEEGTNYVGRTVVITSGRQGFQVAFCSANGEAWEIYEVTVVERGGGALRTDILLPPEIAAKPGDRYRVTEQHGCPGFFDEVTMTPL